MSPHTDNVETPWSQKLVPATVAPRVLVLCPEYAPPCGGIRKLYRHVDVLNRHGLSAAILYQKDGFRLTWFNHSTPLVYAESTPLGTNDFLVVPEVFGPNLAKLAPGIRKIIYNQNSYLTFRGYSMEPNDLRTPYTHADVVAVLTVSEDNRAYLAHAFPSIRLFRVRYGINVDMFTNSHTKKNMVALMPRKNAEDVVQVVNILKHRGALDGYQLVVIDQRSEEEVARLLRECAFFLSFGYPEGCPLPPLEAMACGCTVIGYHGGGGREYFLPDFCYPIEIGDVVAFAKVTEKALRAWRQDRKPFELLGERAAAYVREHFSPAREELDILSFWRIMLNESGYSVPIRWQEGA